MISFISIVRYIIYGHSKHYITEITYIYLVKHLASLVMTTNRKLLNFLFTKRISLNLQNNSSNGTVGSHLLKYNNDDF